MRYHNITKDDMLVKDVRRIRSLFLLQHPRRNQYAPVEEAGKAPETA